MRVYGGVSVHMGGTLVCICAREEDLNGLGSLAA